MPNRGRAKKKEPFNPELDTPSAPFLSEVEIPKLSDYFLTPLLKDGSRISLEDFFGECTSLTDEYRKVMLLQLNHYLFQLQRSSVSCPVLNLCDVKIREKKKDAEGKSIDIRKLADFYCFILTGGAKTEYDKNITASDITCDDQYIALDIIQKIAEKDLNTISAVLKHPFHWSDAKKINSLCNTYDYIYAECDKMKMDEKEVNDFQDDDQHKKLTKTCSDGSESGKSKKNISKREIIVEKYKLGEEGIIPKKWLDKLMLDRDDMKLIKERSEKSPRLVRQPDDDIIYNLRFNNVKTQKPGYRVDDIYELLHFFRNRHAHYWEFNNKVRLAFGSQNSGYWKFFSKKFPKLFMYVFNTVIPKIRISNDECSRYDDEEYIAANQYLPVISREV